MTVDWTDEVEVEDKKSILKLNLSLHHVVGH